ncbi:hypothetical protein PR048_029908 [Dryococelus australis]|uniref:Tesmin/TSO1-like CXC domain-containing protein n=1 Tax=Dryococelus australis TaxID=614101 RepID=A0ABQ9GA85_9NEOP|nr:hypothetical protein PR048_029908 [Dryococelus australis]
MSLEPAPDTILKQISCSCKKSCSIQQCNCFKSGVRCSALCQICDGATCSKKEIEDSELPPAGENYKLLHFEDLDGEADSVSASEDDPNDEDD